MLGAVVPTAPLAELPGGARPAGSPAPGSAAGSASSATTRASRVKHKGAGAGVAAAAAGSVYIRDFLPPADEARVEALRASLPVDVPYEDNPVSHARSLHKRYFNDAPPGDADAWIVPLFEAALREHPAEHWARDGVHPTRAGAALMAKEWLRIVSAR